MCPAFKRVPLTLFAPPELQAGRIFLPSSFRALHLLQPFAPHFGQRFDCNFDCAQQLRRVQSASADRQTFKFARLIIVGRQSDAAQPKINFELLLAQKIQSQQPINAGAFGQSVGQNGKRELFLFERLYSVERDFRD